MDIRSKAEEVEKTGALDRGEFNPTGKPKAIYEYWVKHSLIAPPKTENFCHFWRVVAIWAPLAYLRVNVSNVFEKSSAWYTVAGLYVLASILLSIFVSPGALLMIAIPYTLANMATLVVLFQESWDLTEEEQGFKYFAYATPIGTGIYALLRGLYLGSKKIPQPSVRVKNFLDWVFLLIVGSTLVAIIVGASLEFGWTLLWVVLSVVGVLLGLLVLALVVRWGVSTLGEYLHNKRVEIEQEEWEQKMYRLENGIPEPEPTPPGRIKRFFRGIGDFILLVWNIIRVNKWKICPIVKIEA